MSTSTRSNGYVRISDDDELGNVVNKKIQQELADGRGQTETKPHFRMHTERTALAIVFLFLRRETKDARSQQFVQSSTNQITVCIMAGNSPLFLSIVYTF